MSVQVFSNLYFPFKDRIYDSVLIRENTGQRKPVFCHLLRSVILCTNASIFVNANSWYIWNPSNSSETGKHKTDSLHLSYATFKPHFHLNFLRNGLWKVTVTAVSFWETPFFVKTLIKSVSEYSFIELLQGQ